MNKLVDNYEVFGFIRPYVDAHTLGVSVVANLLRECGYKVIIGDVGISLAVAQIAKLDNISFLCKWIRDNKISRLGFSYRLDPKDAKFAFGKLLQMLKDHRQLQDQGGIIKQVYFAGLPEACNLIALEYKNSIPVFVGDETPMKTLKLLGIPDSLIPSILQLGSAYDEERLRFSTELIQSGKYQDQQPYDRSGYVNYGKKNDTLVDRIRYNRQKQYPPLTRVHVGPYQPDYENAKKEFKSWLKQLAQTKFLDIVSIGSSQLSQSDFGKEWGDKPNGGGAPINSEKDLIEIWDASRPMLVRTYAGTKNIPYLAEIYERTIHIAWHALSLWWFNKIDGRGSNTVKENLEEHFKTIQFIAKTGKPLEPNIPHHFSFRGGDDYTYVLSAYLAAIMAKKMGIRYLVVQTMLNTPKYTWGIQDLAKARALLKLVREIEDKNFIVFLQPRAGLDFFSPDLDKAKAQLASVTAMMDDIEPNNPLSPDIIHVVSYCEAVKLASPKYINESIQITINALNEYKRLKSKGLINDMKNNEDINSRTADIYRQVKSVVSIIEQNIPLPYTPEGFYTIFKKGIMPVPYLWSCRDEFKEAVKWNTSLINGGMQVVDELGQPIPFTKRVKELFNCR